MDAESSEYHFTAKRNLQQRVKKSLPPLLSMATSEQVGKFSLKAGRQVRKFSEVFDSDPPKKEQSASSASLGSTSGTSNDQKEKISEKATKQIPGLGSQCSTDNDSQILNGNQGSPPIQETSEISWDSENELDDILLSSTQKSAYESFKKTFTKFALPGGET